MTSVFLRGASGLIWNNTFLAFTSLPLAGTVTVLVSGPYINFISLTSKVVDHWALAVDWCTFSSPAATIVMVVGVFVWSAWSKIGLVSHASGTSLILLLPSEGAEASNSLALIGWVALDSVDWFALAVWWW